MNVKENIKEIEHHIALIEEGHPKNVIAKMHKVLEETHKSLEKLEDTLSQKDGDMD